MNDYIKDLDGEWKHIVIADSWDTDKPAREAFFMPGMDDGGLFTGKFSLTGGNKKHEELFEYLQICNYKLTIPFHLSLWYFTNPIGLKLSRDPGNPF